MARSMGVVVVGGDESVFGQREGGGRIEWVRPAQEEVGPAEASPTESYPPSQTQKSDSVSRVCASKIADSEEKPH